MADTQITRSSTPTYIVDSINDTQDIQGNDLHFPCIVYVQTENAEYYCPGGGMSSTRIVPSPRTVKTMSASQLDNGIALACSGNVRVLDFTCKVLTTLDAENFLFKVDAADKPPRTTYGALVARSSGAWGSATYQPVPIIVDTSGNCYIRCKTNSILANYYVTGQIFWLTE